MIIAQQVRQQKLLRVQLSGLLPVQTIRDSLNVEENILVINAFNISYYICLTKCKKDGNLNYLNFNIDIN